MVLHQEGLQVLMKYATDFQTEIEETIKTRTAKDRIASAGKAPVRRELSTISESVLLDGKGSAAGI